MHPHGRPLTQAGAGWSGGETPLAKRTQAWSKLKSLLGYATRWQETSHSQVLGEPSPLPSPLGSACAQSTSGISLSRGEISVFPKGRGEEQDLVSFWISEF